MNVIQVLRFVGLRRKGRELRPHRNTEGVLVGEPFGCQGFDVEISFPIAVIVVQI